MIKLDVRIFLQGRSVSVDKLLAVGYLASWRYFVEYAYLYDADMLS